MLTQLLQVLRAMLDSHLVRSRVMDLWCSGPVRSLLCVCEVQACGPGQLPWLCTRHHTCKSPFCSAHLHLHYATM